MRLSLRFIIPLAIVLAEIAYAIVPLVKVMRLFDRIMQDERIFAIGFCDLEHIWPKRPKPHGSWK